VVPLWPNVNAFEKELEKFVTSVNSEQCTVNSGLAEKRVVALSAGTAAVHLGLLACGVKPGDEVIVQSFTFCASTHPVTYLGATPVLVDSEPDTWNMDPELLEVAIKDRIEKSTMEFMNMLYIKQKSCQHDYKNVGHDSHYDYYMCDKCGSQDRW
jgi:dTDP-4-amino-4,6-dideoxygalactose transaminase